MAYIGKSPAEQGQVTSEQEFTATDVIGGGVGQRAFTLTTTVSRETDIIVSINGVVQPASAYTLSGTTLSFAAPGLTLNDVLRVHYIGYRPTYFGLQPGSVDVAHLSFQAGGPSLGTNAIIRTNGKTIVANITFAGTENGMSAGPITIADTKTVTVTDGSTWTVF
jgi:hypothetical protein